MDRNNPGQISGLALLSATATDIKNMLDEGTISTKNLIISSLNLINSHNKNGMNLNALIDVAPESKLIEWAEELDKERSSGNSRGPFHGVTIVLKDTIDTDPQLGLATTLGSYALKDAKPPRNALVVETLIKQGLLVLGKANLSEFGSNKCPEFVAGYSPVGGQTRSAYIESDNDDQLLKGHKNPGGSSTGSAVAASAGFCPWAIGAETNGSLNSPASRASLYALKPTPGSVSDDGVFKLTNAFDTLGGMAKSVADLAALTEMLFSTLPELEPASWSLKASLAKEFQKTRLGFVDIDKWQLPKSILEPDDSYLQQRKEDWHYVMDKLRQHGAEIEYPIDLKAASEYKFDGQSGYSIIRYGEWPHLASKYLSRLGNTSIRSLEDIINFSKEHPDLEFSPEAPSQQSLINVLCQNISAEQLESAFRTMRNEAGKEGLGRAIDDHNLDVLVAPTDSPISTVAALAGYPVGTMPLGYIKPIGRPHGLSVIAKANDERKILRVMSIYEATIFQRKLPPPLVKRLAVMKL